MKHPKVIASLYELVSIQHQQNSCLMWYFVICEKKKLREISLCFYIKLTYKKFNSSIKLHILLAYEFTIFTLCSLMIFFWFIQIQQNKYLMKSKQTKSSKRCSSYKCLTKWQQTITRKMTKNTRKKIRQHWQRTKIKKTKQKTNVKKM